MRYRINFDKTVNQLVPHYFGGRKLILYLQALLKPLQILNNQFIEWSSETKIEATMTSQIIKLEWFLNRKFKKYFEDPSQLIFVKNDKRAGVPIYIESADIAQSDNLNLKYESEGDKRNVFHYSDEISKENDCSFYVYSPKINERLISESEYIAMISYYVDKYKISGKTYKIKFNLA